MNQSLEQVIFHKIIKDPELTDKCQSEFFDLKYIQIIFKVIKPYVLQYKTAPGIDQTLQIIENSDLQDKVKEVLNKDIITSLWQAQDNISSYDAEWLDDQVKAWLTWATFMRGLQNTLSYVKTIQNDVTNANYVELVDKAKNIFSTQTGIDFNNNGAGIDLFDPEAHKTVKLVRYSTGYPFIDHATKGGYWPGSLWVFMAAPKAGKSRLLQSLACQAIRNGIDCAYASFELQEEIITQRMGANLFNIDIDHYEEYGDNTERMTQKIKEFQLSLLKKPGRISIKDFPTSAVSVNELEFWLLKEEERISQEINQPFKFKNVYVDYINIMKNWRNPNSENTYMKIKQIAEDLRAMAMKNKWCIISVTQVKQEYFNKDDLNLASASESSALAATVDMLFGLITDVVNNSKNICFIKTIVTRVSGFFNERKQFNIDTKHMRLEEDMESPIIKDENIESFAKESQKIVDRYNNTNNIVTAVSPNLGTTEAQLNVTKLFS